MQQAAQAAVLLLMAAGQSHLSCSARALCPRRAMLEQAQNRRLLPDSDSDEEPAKPGTQAALKAKPTDVLQEVSGGQRLVLLPLLLPGSRAAPWAPRRSFRPCCPSRMSSSVRAPCALGRKERGINRCF